MGLLSSRLWKVCIGGLCLAMVCATGGCKPSPWTLWDSYSSRYIDAQGRVIDAQGGDHTTSEGQAYAMFFALVDNDRPTFDRVLTWTQANLAGGDLQSRLPAWNWGKDKDGTWKILDPNPASDADVWMAYTLIEAGSLWQNQIYTTIGQRMMAMIAQKEVVSLPGFGFVLMPGPVGFHDDKSWTLNPSYVPLFIFERFSVVDPGGPWQQVALGIPKLIEQSARHGFAMDWVKYIPGDGFSPTNLNTDPAAKAVFSGGSYDAIRVYLWAGLMDPRSPTRGEILSALPGMSLYLADHNYPPEKVDDQGIPQPQDGPVGFSAAILPYLRALSNQSHGIAQQTVRLSVERDKATGLYGKDLSYYDQNLALFATGFLDGRFQFGRGGELKVEWKGK